MHWWIYDYTQIIGPIKVDEHNPSEYSAIGHIGSTVIPGLVAEPIVDIMTGYGNTTSALDEPSDILLLLALTSIGSEYMGESPAIPRPS
ncbi:hypothetical protein DFJ77DRAFT_508917 [Powellomyces hirtus]|nr:hypothetical protein DFJ77DRAFT_508917 [Powellomyces hirtus]